MDIVLYMTLILFLTQEIVSGWSNILTDSLTLILYPLNQWPNLPPKKWHQCAVNVQRTWRRFSVYSSPACGVGHTAPGKCCGTAQCTSCLSCKTSEKWKNWKKILKIMPCLNTLNQFR